MSSYKYKCGFKHLLPPIIIKESNNLNINIENIIPMQNKCPSGKNCPNYKRIFELKQEIINLIDKISQLKKINDYSVPNTIPHPKFNNTPQRESEKNNNNLYTQLINSFRNSSKNKLLELKNNSYKNNLFKNSIFNPGKVKLRPNSAKSSDLKESYEKLFNKERKKTEEKTENENNISNANRKINMNLFSSSSRKINENSTKNIKINNNQRYESDNINESNSTYSHLFNHESFSSLRKSKINELSSLNFHLSNSIISPAIKITPKNLFDSLKFCGENKENKIINDNENNYK